MLNMHKASGMVPSCFWAGIRTTSNYRQAYSMRHVENRSL
jgi:hypothetical protein